MQIEIKSKPGNDMSTWQFTNSLDGLTTINNKLTILNEIIELISRNTSKNSIFIFNKSFNINTSYCSYFDNGNYLNLNNVSDLNKIMYMGSIIPFEFNERLSNIQYLLNTYKAMNRLISRYRKKNGLHNNYTDSTICDYVTNSTIDISKTIEHIYNIFLERLSKTYSELKDPDMSASTTLNTHYKNSLNGYTKYINNCKEKTNSKFINAFTSYSRPIIGNYIQTTNQIEIVNYLQMYKGGANNNNDLTLIKAGRNSPIKFTLNTVNIMESSLKFMAHKYHDQTFKDENIPLNTNDFLNTIFNTDDEDIKTLSNTILNKLKEFTNPRKISLCALEER